MKIIVVLLLFTVILILATLIKNDANLLKQPGPVQRMKVFLTTNVAETADNHVFSELETPVFDLPAAVLYQRVLQSAIKLNWQVVDNDSEDMTATFIVQSVAFAFKDDILAHVNSIDETTSSLYLRSASRLGKADFAANSAHLQALIKGIRTGTELK